MNGPRRSGRHGAPAEIAAVLLLLGIGLALGLPRHRGRIDLADEGLLVYGAQRVLEGELPNRDFVSLQPPLSYYSTALVFRALGTSLVSARRFGLLLYLLIPLGVYALSRQLAARGPALAASLPAPFLGMTIWVYAPYPTAQGIVLSLGTAWLLLRAARTGGAGWAVASGVGTALVILARHDQGFYVVVAAALFAGALRLARRGEPTATAARRLLWPWAAGAAALLLPLILLWWSAGALPGMFRDLVAFPLTRYAGTSSLPMPGPGDVRDLAGLTLLALFYLAPVLAGGALVLLGFRAARGRLGAGDAEAAFVALLALGFYHQVLTRSDVYHLVDTLPPLFVVGAFWLELLRRTLERRLRGRAARAPLLAGAGAAAAGVLLWGLVVAQTHGTFLLPALRQGAPLALRRGGVLLPPSERWIGPTVDLLRRQVPADRSLLVLPYQPMFYFLADRRNPTRWNYFWPGDQTAEDHAAFLRQAAADPPAAVLLFQRQDLARYAGPVVDWVERRFVPLAAGAGGAPRLYVEPRAGDSGGATRP